MLRTRLTSALLLLLLGALTLFAVGAGGHGRFIDPSLSRRQLHMYQQHHQHPLYLEASANLHLSSTAPKKPRHDVVWRDYVASIAADSVMPLVLRLFNDHFSYLHDDFTNNDHNNLFSNTSRIMTPKERLGLKADHLQSLNSPAALVATFALLMFMI